MRLTCFLASLVASPSDSQPASQPAHLSIHPFVFPSIDSSIHVFINHIRSHFRSDMLPEPPAPCQSQSQSHSQRLFSLGVHIEMSTLDPQVLLINHIRRMIRYQRLIMGLPAEDDDSRASSHDSTPGLVTPTSSSSDVSQRLSSMPDEMFPVREIEEHRRWSV